MTSRPSRLELCLAQIVMISSRVEALARSWSVSEMILVRKAVSADCWALRFSRFASVPVIMAVRNITKKLTGYPDSYTFREKRG